MLEVSFAVELGASGVVEVVDCLGEVDLDGVVKSTSEETKLHLTENEL